MELTQDKILGETREKDVTSSGDIDHDSTINTHNLTTSIDHNTINNNHNLTTDINHNTILNNHDLTTDINHNTIFNNHNLTTDIDHDDITNTHNLTTDIDHDDITNTHNLTTDIDHDDITNTHNIDFTTGYIHFGDFAEDSNLFWDNTNKRLGVGIASPQKNIECISFYGKRLFAGITSPTEGINKTFNFDDRKGDNHSIIITSGLITTWDIT